MNKNAEEYEITSNIKRVKIAKILLERVTKKYVWKTFIDQYRYNTACDVQIRQNCNSNRWKRRVLSTPLQRAKRCRNDQLQLSRSSCVSLTKDSDRLLAGCIVGR
ncbi:hypothetical protein CEXT_571581 [Caerostris extrusa]|uniref:Uncharacterized protein n=1 Tax=Caerostris extrusa TaxID=172846 RepID=A0AAV4WHM3_CAEEX|nr:hypothetical protein CEXT_571581 [Caerostris extrusa]